MLWSRIAKLQQRNFFSIIKNYLPGVEAPEIEAVGSTV